jgi:hypothetical protein
VKGSKGIQNTLLLFHYLSTLSIKFSGSGLAETSISSLTPKKFLPDNVVQNARFRLHSSVTLIVAFTQLPEAHTKDFLGIDFRS